MGREKPELRDDPCFDLIGGVDISIKRLAVTATQAGGTALQLETAAEFLLRHAGTLTEFHHGGCVGGDEDLAYLVHRLLPHVQVHLHPGDNPAKYATYAYDTSDWIVYKAKDNLARNRDIVDVTEHLLALPETVGEVLRSGTWATIRYSRDKVHKPRTLIYPDGTEHYFSGGET